MLGDYGFDPLRLGSKDKASGWGIFSKDIRVLIWCGRGSWRLWLARMCWPACVAAGRRHDGGCHMGHVSLRRSDQ